MKLLGTDDLSMCVLCNCANLPLIDLKPGLLVVAGKETVCEGLWWLSFMGCMEGRVYYGCVI